MCIFGLEELLIVAEGFDQFMYIFTNFFLSSPRL